MTDREVTARLYPRPRLEAKATPIEPPLAAASQIVLQVLRDAGAARGVRADEIVQLGIRFPSICITDLRTRGYVIEPDRRGSYLTYRLVHEPHASAAAA